MKKLLVGAWIVFALDLVILGLMVREVLIGDFGAAERAFATTVTVGMAAWICFINLVLVVSWWRESRTGLWVAVVCGALPLLWAWTMAVQAFSDVGSAPQ